VTCSNDREGSHGFCLLNNVGIGAAYARHMLRGPGGVSKVAIVDFDVHVSYLLDYYRTLRHT
jgi:acetoin utilization deacetylase AcuC-like enzyme